MESASMRKLNASLLRALAFIGSLFCGCVDVQAHSALPRFEVGPVLSVVHDIEVLPSADRLAVGGRFTINFNPHIAFDSDALITTSRGFSGLNTGGRLTQGYFGIKAGTRWNKIDIFGKVRPGFWSYAEVITGQTGATPPMPILSRFTYPAVDVGGVVEFYLSRRFALRYDIGDTVVHYHEVIFNNSASPFIIPSVTTHSFQFSTGISYRFK